MDSGGTPLKLIKESVLSTVWYRADKDAYYYAGQSYHYDDGPYINLQIIVSGRANLLNLPDTGFFVNMGHLGHVYHEYCHVILSRKYDYSNELWQDIHHDPMTHFARALVMEALET